MKIFLVILSGFVLTLAIFAGGAVTTFFFLHAEPVPVRAASADAADVWTAEPVEVNTAAQDFERLPARPVPQQAENETQDQAEAQEPVIVADQEPVVVAEAEELIDTTTTASISPDAAVQPVPPARRAMSAAHLEWCSDRYRSYRPEDNSYTPYSGGSRECVSPFSEVMASLNPPAAPEAAGSYADTAGDGVTVIHLTNERAQSGLTDEHIRSCFERYRSYRIEDNSYQPYGGGPRRQCR